MSTLFISHSSVDREQAIELKQRLEAQGHRSVFLDLDPEKGIQLGTSWERTLYTKLRACRAVVALCSDHYLASKWCFAEIALARMEGKQIFALQIDPCEASLPSILTERQYADLRRDPEAGYRWLWHGFKVAGLVPQEAREWGNESPYPGLRAFEEVDAAVFFGREREVRESLEQLTRVRRQGHPRMVMVLGASGCGKSSLVRAGIVPRLRQDAESFCVVGPLRPGRTPNRELAAALSQALERAGRPRPWQAIFARLEAWPDAPDSSPAAVEQAVVVAEPPPSPAASAADAAARQRLQDALHAIAGQLGEHDAALAQSVRDLRALLERPGVDMPAPVPAAPPDLTGNPLAALTTELRLAGGHADASVVIVIDQFEELLGHGDAPDHPANRFLALLRDGLETDDRGPLVLGTMRSDFLGALQVSAPLRGLGFGSISLGPMDRTGMRELIERPAVLGQLQLEDGLTQRLLDETGSSDALPLLAFTLRVMWDRYHHDSLLEMREYEELGGLHGAIALVAGEALDAALRDGDETALRDAFLRLARPSAQGHGWARQPVAWDELPAAVHPMLERFVRSRLLVKRSDGTLEVAHEAIFRAWAKLRGWLAENAEALTLLHEIESDARKWSGGAGDQQSYLWRGGRLARAGELRDHGMLGLGGLGRQFIAASEAAEQAERDAEEARRKAEEARKQQEREVEAARKQRDLRRTRIFGGVVSVLCLVSLVFLVMAQKARDAAVAQQKIANNAERKAQQQQTDATARKLSFAAQHELGRDRELSLLLSLEGVKHRPLPELYALLNEGVAGEGEALRRFEHGGKVRAGAWHPDGQRVVTTSYDNDQVTVWDADSLEVHMRCQEKAQDSVVWSPDGSRFVAGGPWEGAIVARPDDRSCAFEHRLPRCLVHAAFSSNGKQLVTSHNDRCSNGRSAAVLWNTDGWSAAPLLDGEVEIVTRQAVFSPGPDSQWIATADKDDRARIWDARSAQPVLRLEHGAPVRAVAWDPAGKRVLTVGEDHLARIWDAQTGASLATLRGHSAAVLTSAFSPDGTQVATAGEDQTARLWDAASGLQQATLVGHRGTVLWVEWNHDGSRLVTAGHDGSARVWDARGQLQAVLLGHSGRVASAHFRPKSSLLLTVGDDGTARIWDPSVGPMRHEDVVNSVAFSPDGARVLTASDDGRAGIWDVASRSLVTMLEHRKGDGALSPVKYAAFSHMGDRIVSVSEDHTAVVWDAGDGRKLMTYAEHGEKVSHAAWRPLDDGAIATASDDRTARIWDPKTGKTLQTLSHDYPVGHVAWERNGERLSTTALEERQARVWNARTGQQLAVLAGHAGFVNQTAWSPAGPPRILTANNEARTGVFEPDGTLLRFLPHSGTATRAAFSHDGTRIATVSEDQLAHVWTLESDGDPLVLKGHSGEVRAVAWANEDRKLLTASKDGTARVWDPATGATLHQLTGHTAPLLAVDWHPKGTLVVTGSRDGTARLFLLEQDELIAAACRRLTRNLTDEEWKQYMGAVPYHETCTLTRKPLPSDRPASHAQLSVH